VGDVLLCDPLQVQARPMAVASVYAGLGGSEAAAGVVGALQVLEHWQGYAFSGVV